MTDEAEEAQCAESQADAGEEAGVTSAKRKRRRPPGDNCFEGGKCVFEPTGPAWGPQAVDASAGLEWAEVE